MKPQIRNWEIAGRDPETGKFVLRRVVDDSLGRFATVLKQNEWGNFYADGVEKPWGCEQGVWEHIVGYLNKSGGYCTVGQLARILSQHGQAIGRNNLYGFLEKQGVIGQYGSEGYRMLDKSYGITIDLDLRDYGKRYGFGVALGHFQPLLTVDGCLAVVELLKKEGLWNA